MTPLAHAGHWLVNLLYVLPVAVIGGGLLWQALKDRRAARREAAEGRSQDPPA